MKRLSISQNNEVIAKIDTANQKEDRKVCSPIGCFDFCLENLKFSGKFKFFCKTIEI